MRASSLPTFRTLLIGGGGYGFPRYIEAVYPRAHVEVIEIDPLVTEISYRRLGLSRDTRIVTHNSDARPLIASWAQTRQFDLIFADAFNDVAMPYHLTTVEFAQRVDSILAPNGVYVLNAIDHYRDHGDVVRSFVLTLGQVFAHVYLLRWGPHDPEAIETLVIAASHEPYDLEPLRQRHPIPEQPGTSYGSQPIEGDELARFRSRGRAILLTDDYAPIDQLTAPLFLRRG